MGTTVGRENPAVTPDLWAEPFAFDFIQAVRLLQARASNRGSVGHDTAPGHEVVRFSVHRDLGFPASQIHDPRSEVAGRRAASTDDGRFHRG